MDQYIDYSGQAGYHEAAEESLQDHLPRSNSNFDNPSHQKSAYFGQNVPQTISCDIKPRLTKEQHDILEAHFQKQNKPNTSTKKQFAESLNVSLEKVNVSSITLLGNIWPELRQLQL